MHYAFNTATTRDRDAFPRLRLIVAPPSMQRGGGQNLERPIYRKFETSNIEITKVKFYKLSNFKNLLIVETQQSQKFDYFFSSLSIRQILVLFVGWGLKF